MFVFFLDTIRVDQLRLDGSTESAPNFIERKLQEGTSFDQFVVAGNSTRVSVSAFFTGFFGGTTGFNFHVDCDDVFANSRVVGMADIFKHEGYQTLAVSQVDKYLPSHGFDAFWTFQETMDLDLIEAELAITGDPAFTYLHFSDLHDVAFGQPELMTRENYRIHLDLLAEEVEAVWQRLVGPQDVVVLVSDHGCHLRKGVDPDWRFYHEEEPTGGIFLSEETIRGVCSIVGPGLFPVTSVKSLTRTVDVLPTLFDGLGIKYPGVQGCSLWPTVAAAAPVPELVAYMETGGQRQANGQASSRGVRTEDWKFVRYEAWGEELYDLRHDPQATTNLIGTGLPAEKTMRRLFDDQIAENRCGVESFQVAEQKLAARILSGRGPLAPSVEGPRGSCFGGMVNDDVRAHLGREITRYLPQWVNSGQRIAVYSASEHTQAFLADEDLMGSGLVVGVVDSNPALSGQEFCSLPIVALAEMESQLKPTLILVGHYFFANDMYLRIRENCQQQVPVFNIYRLAAEVPLWWDREAATTASACTVKG